MIRIFIIPTWIGHFDKNLNFLQTCQKYSIKIPIKFVVSNWEEELELQSRIGLSGLGSTLDIQIISIDRVIQKFKPEITIGEIENIKTSINRFPYIWNPKHPYQGIKKIYALRYFEYDQAMLLDSECAFIKETDMEELFDEYFTSPYVFFTPHNQLHPNLRIFTNAAQKCLRWSDLSKAKDNWFFENLYWMVDKKIVVDMFETIEKEVGTDLYTEYTTNAGEIFEIITYYTYIYINNVKYRYNFLDFFEIIQRYLGDKYTEYTLPKSQRLGGFLEFMLENIDTTTYGSILRFIEDYRIRFCRPEWCDPDLYIKAVKESPYLNMILACESTPEFCKILNS